MRALLVGLLIAVPAMADPKRPSAIDVEATLVHDREVLTKQATALCACTDQKCGDKVIDEFLRWKLDLDLVRDRKGFENYVEAVDGDGAIAVQRDIIQDCNGFLRAKPWARSCQKRIANAAAAFAREAPRAYAPYKKLKFTNRPEPDRKLLGTIAEAHINPGRTWDFLAIFGTRSIATQFGVVDDITEQWMMHNSTRGLSVIRSFGPHVAVLVIQSERWGDFEDTPSQHPLAKLYFEKMQAAADRCVRN